jgi:hypothetical protein
MERRDAAMAYLPSNDGTEGCSYGVYVYVCEWMFMDVTCAPPRMHACMYACMNVSMYVCTTLLCIYIRTHAPLLALTLQ